MQYKSLLLIRFTGDFFSSLACGLDIYRKSFNTSRRNYGASVQSEYSIVDLIQESRYFIGHLRLLV
jgi:hypothetical protein